MNLLEPIQGRFFFIQEAVVNVNVALARQFKLLLLFESRLDAIFEHAIVLLVHVWDAANGSVAHYNPKLIVELETGEDIGDLDAKLDGELHHANTEGHECWLEVLRVSE